MNICHFDKINKVNIEADFQQDNHGKSHRLSLILPFKETREDNRKICIIGQNPSKADKEYADKTLYYLERYVYEKMNNYSKIIMLNLYTRVDTEKKATENLEVKTLEEIINYTTDNETDFLIVYGQLTNQGEYKFINQARELKRLLKDRKVFKIDINTPYAPHPRNPKIYYGNFCHNITEYNFSDIPEEARS